MVRAGLEVRAFRLQVCSALNRSATHCLLLKAFWKRQTQTISNWHIVCFQIKFLTKHLPVPTQFKDINRSPAHIYLDLPKVNLTSDLTSFWVSRASLGVLVSSLLKSFVSLKRFLFTFHSKNGDWHHWHLGFQVSFGSPWLHWFHYNKDNLTCVCFSNMERANLLTLCLRCHKQRFLV